MKLREEVMEYQVRYHGTEYEDPYKPIAGICPECQSQDIRESTDYDGTLADWVCNACGCKFDSHITWKRTKLGNAISKVITGMIVVLIIGMVVCIFAGLIWFNHKAQAFGGKEAVPDVIRLKAMAISIGGPIVCGILCSIMTRIDDKI